MQLSCAHVKLSQDHFKICLVSHSALSHSFPLVYHIHFPNKGAKCCETYWKHLKFLTCSMFHLFLFFLDFLQLIIPFSLSHVLLISSCLDLFPFGCSCRLLILLPHFHGLCYKFFKGWPVFPNFPYSSVWIWELPNPISWCSVCYCFIRSCWSCRAKSVHPTSEMAALQGWV